MEMAGFIQATSEQVVTRVSRLDHKSYKKTTKMADILIDGEKLAM